MTLRMPPGAAASTLVSDTTGHLQRSCGVCASPGRGVLAGRVGPTLCEAGSLNALYLIGVLDANMLACIFIINICVQNKSVNI